MATATVGKTTDGASSSASSGDKIASSSATAAATGTLTSGVARVWLSATGSSATKMTVHADSSGAPGALLAVSGEVVVTQTAEAGVAYTFSGAQQITITSGVTYWIGVFWQDPGTISINFSRDGTAGGRLENSGVTYPTTPNPFGTGAANAGPIDAYVTITLGGGSGISLTQFFGAAPT